MGKVLVIGAGFGGLSVAAELSRRGHQVTVLEAHTYPGGSAGTFYHKGYRFDAGATLAGGFASGAVMDRIGQHLDIDWQASLSSNGMRVHLKDGSTINRWTESEQWIAERNTHFGMAAEPFWEWQESTADLLWNFALRLPYWPPQSAFEFYSLANHVSDWLRGTSSLNKPARTASLIRDAFRKVKAHIPPSQEKLRQFVDAQLLISAQTTSGNANALYGSAALDLTRQGVAHVPGGMGGMAEKLVDTVQKNGGQVHFRQEVQSVHRNREDDFIVTTKRKHEFISNVIICNLPPWNIAQLMPDKLPRRLRKLPAVLSSGWGAFMLYVGMDASSIDTDLPLHHQVVAEEPLGEANSIFLSLSPHWDESRAPAGKRALTISTHTNLGEWWKLFSSDREAYDARKSEYVERVLSAAERVINGIKSDAELVMPGTPVTFQRFTRRHKGWVGGFPQTSLFRSWTPHITKGIWMVGDSVFPGQSVPAVMLSGLRVAQAVEHNELHAAEGSKLGYDRFNGILDAR